MLIHDNMDGKTWIRSYKNLQTVELVFGSARAREKSRS
jgi:hypothetical protein